MGKKLNACIFVCADLYIQLVCMLRNYIFKVELQMQLESYDIRLTHL